MKRTVAMVLLMQLECTLPVELVVIHIYNIYMERVFVRERWRVFRERERERERECVCVRV